jgi:hypothetical protein
VCKCESHANIAAKLSEPCFAEKFLDQICAMMLYCICMSFYSWFHITFPWMLRTSFRTSLWSSKVHNEIHKPVTKPLIGLFLLRDQSEALFTYGFVNFSMNFWTSQRSSERSSQHSRKSYMKSTVKAHTDRTRFGNATRIFSFQKQIKPSTDKNFTRYADQIAKIA